MPNNENDLSDNSGNPHIGSNFDDFLEEEGIREEVEHAAMEKILQDQSKRITITITGPVGRGKTVIIDAIEKLLRDQFDAKKVFVDAHIQQERNAMNLVDYRNAMHEIIQQNTYLLHEETVVQTAINGDIDPRVLVFGQPGYVGNGNGS